MTAVEGASCRVDDLHKNPTYWHRTHTVYHSQNRTQHVHSDQMAEWSETIVLDVVAEETSHGDMIEILKQLQGYLGKDLEEC